MIKYLFVIAYQATAFLHRDSQHIDLDPSQKAMSLTFGSCYGLYSYQSQIFKTIAEQSDVFIWLGDVAYLDTHSWWF